MSSHKEQKDRDDQSNLPGNTGAEVNGSELFSDVNNETAVYSTDQTLFEQDHFDLVEPVPLEGNNSSSSEVDKDWKDITIPTRREETGDDLPGSEETERLALDRTDASSFSQGVLRPRSLSRVARGRTGTESGNRNLHIRPGMIFGQYRMDWPAGHGSMGEVWKAFDLVGERIVAIKFVPKDIEDYEKEVQRAKHNFIDIHNLNHQYICPIHGILEDRDFGYFLVMKWMPYTLEDYVSENADAEGKIAVKAALKILSDTAAALDYIHSQGVIHRDLKPSNIAILKNESGELESANLIDFGLAYRMERGERVSEEQKASLCGTPRFLAPEQWVHPSPSPLSDQYALATIAFCLLGGRYPFVAPNLKKLKSSIINDPVPQLPGMPRRINRALQRGMAKSPRRRFYSCSDFVSAMTRPVPLKFRTATLFAILFVLMIVVAAIHFVLILKTNRNSSPEFRPIHSLFSFHAGITGSDLAFFLTPEEESGKNLAEPTVAAVSPPRTPCLRIGKKVHEGLDKEHQGEGWSYHRDKSSATGILTLKNYQGEAIACHGTDLKIVIADDTENKISGLAERSAIDVSGGNLVVTGARSGTGSLRLLPGKSDQEHTNGITLHSPKSNLAIGRLRSLVIETEKEGNGIEVVNGNLTVRDLELLKISVPRGKDAIVVHGDISLTGSQHNSCELSGGLWHGGLLAVQSPKGNHEKLTRPPFKLILCGLAVTDLVATFSELQTAINRKGDEKVILVTAGIDSAPYWESPQSDKERTRMTVASGKTVLLSSGSWFVRRGAMSDYREEMLNVQGKLQLGAPNGMGSATLALQGNAAFVRSRASRDGTPPVKMNHVCPTQDGQSVEIYKYTITKPSQKALIVVSGQLDMYDGCRVEDNCNSNVCVTTTESRSDSDPAKYTGGICVLPGGIFNMYGGTITRCQGAWGGGLNVGGSFHMHGGQITDNTSYNSGSFSTGGGGISLTGKFKMSGGSITRNLAVSNDTSILGTNAAKGGGLYCRENSKAIITGGKIEGNVSLWGGGGLYAEGNGTTELVVAGAAKITGNVAVLGGGLYANTGITLSGGLLQGNSVFDLACDSQPAGKGLYLTPINSANLNEPPVIRLENNVLIDPDNPIFIFSNRMTPEINSDPVAFIPIQVAGKLTGEKQRFHVAIGAMSHSTDTSRRLVFYKYLSGTTLEDLKELQKEKFVVDYVSAPTNPKRYDLTEFAVPVNDDKGNVAGHHYYLAVTE